MLSRFKGSMLQKRTPPSKWESFDVCNQGYITHKSWRPLITLMYALEWLLCARYGFQGLEMQPMRFVSCVVHLEGI